MNDDRPSTKSNKTRLTLFRPDQTSADTWRAVHGQSAEYTGEQALLLAVLQRSLMDYAQHAKCTKACRTFRNAQAWLGDPEDEALFSFRYVCHHLGNLDPEQLSARIIAQGPQSLLTLLRNLRQNVHSKRMHTNGSKAVGVGGNHPRKYSKLRGLA